MEHKEREGMTNFHTYRKFPFHPHVSQTAPKVSLRWCGIKDTYYDILSYQCEDNHHGNEPYFQKS